MNLTVNPSKLNGSICVPGSKSHTIRAIAVATLAKGTSIIESPLVSDDTVSCLKAASSFGAWVKRGDDSEWRISGTGGNILPPAGVVDMGNSGTGMRLFSAIAALCDQPVTFDGDDSLRTRPMAPLLEALRSIGAKTSSPNGKCPFTVQGPICGGEAFVDGTSSQYLSALLLTAPLSKLNTLLLVKDLNEIPYVQMTLAWLKREQIQDVFCNENNTHFFVKGGQSYPPFKYRIPGDFSTACFPLAAAAVTGGKIEIDNLDFSDTQGDKAVFDYLKKMGAGIKQKDGRTVVTGGKLKAVDLDLNATPDALPVMAVAAACAKGTSVFRNIPQARLKETDRIACMTTELRKMGISVEEFEDGMAVTGGTLRASKDLDSYKDHRIAMALAVAASAVPGAGAVSRIKDADAASVTYPDFFRDFIRLGANFQLG